MPSKPSELQKQFMIGAFSDKINPTKKNGS